MDLRATWNSATLLERSSYIYVNFEERENFRKATSEERIRWKIEARSVPILLGVVSGLVLRGSVDPGSAYEALGGDVARNGRAIRSLMDGPLGTWVRIQPGLKPRVLVLIDLMWVQEI